MQFLRLEFPGRLVSQADQIFFGEALLILVCRAAGDIEPALQGRVDSLPMGGADVVAVRSLGRPALQYAKARGVIEGIRMAIEVPVDSLEPFPDGIVFLVPTELVGIDKVTRGDTSDDDPGQESVTAGKPQIAR